MTGYLSLSHIVGEGNPNHTPPDCPCGCATVVTESKEIVSFIVFVIRRQDKRLLELLQPRSWISKTYRPYLNLTVCSIMVQYKTRDIEYTLHAIICSIKRRIKHTDSFAVLEVGHGVVRKG